MHRSLRLSSGLAEHLDVIPQQPRCRAVSAAPRALRELQFAEVLCSRDRERPAAATLPVRLGRAITRRNSGPAGGATGFPARRESPHIRLSAGLTAIRDVISSY